MKFDDLDTKMRCYEQSIDQHVLSDMYLVARLDGRSFSRLTKEICDFEVPFDERFRDMMVNTVKVLMDCGFMWAVVIPVVMCIAHLTSLDIFSFYLIGQGTAILKPIAGIVLLCRGKWARRLVGDEPST